MKPKAARKATGTGSHKKPSPVTRKTPAVNKTAPAKASARASVKKAATKPSPAPAKKPTTPKAEPAPVRAIAAPSPPVNGYDEYRDRQAGISRARSASGRDIGTLPPIVDPVRRNLCLNNLRLFNATYFASRFPLPFCPDQLRVTDLLQRVVIEGGQAAIGMPRGFGKTNQCETAAIFAILYGYRRYVVLIGATDALADGIMKSIRDELETNDLLLEDFPEVCFPIRALERMASRARGQTLAGLHTRIEWQSDRLRMPSVPGSVSAGAIVETVGITGAIRGRKRPGPNGTQLRPDLAMLDDPQTDDSADSIFQNDFREKVINGAVLNMSGPGKMIAAICPCTVIAKNDVADRILDRERSPQWNGQRTKLMPSLPADLDWWDRYAELRRESYRLYGDNRRGNELYARERELADRGAVVSWPEKFDPNVNLSAIQEAMNFRIDRPKSFAADGQNDPEEERPDNAADPLRTEELVKRLTRVARATVPRACTRVTAMVDVSESVLWYVVVAWDERFGGSPIDYGCYPKQNRTYFRQADARPTLRIEHPNMPIEAAIFKGLTILTNAILSREWDCESGSRLRVERCLVDAGDHTDTVYGFVRQSPHAAVLLPSKGFGITAAGRPIAEWDRKENERKGQDWIIGTPESGRGWLAKFGANEWKTFVADRFRTPPGAPGCLQLFGTEGHIHQLFADHCASEFPIRTTGRGRKLLEWKLKPGCENHLWDCMVGAAVAASIGGLKWDSGAAAGAPGAVPKRKQKIDIADLYKKANPGEVW